MSWRRARLTFWSSNCQNGRKKKKVPKEWDTFYFFQCVEKLIGKDRVFDWRKFCVHLILWSQLLLPACSDQEGRSSSARAVAAQCDSCHSGSSFSELLGFIRTTVWSCVPGVGSGHWCAFQRILTEGWRKCCVPVLCEQNHSLPVKAQKAGIRNEQCLRAKFSRQWHKAGGSSHHCQRLNGILWWVVTNDIVKISLTYTKIQTVCDFTGYMRAPSHVSGQRSQLSRIQEPVFLWNPCWELCFKQTSVLLKDSREWFSASLWISCMCRGISGIFPFLCLQYVL